MNVISGRVDDDAPTFMTQKVSEEIARRDRLARTTKRGRPSRRAYPARAGPVGGRRVVTGCGQSPGSGARTPPASILLGIEAW